MLWVDCQELVNDLKIVQKKKKIEIQFLQENSFSLYIRKKNV